MFVKSFIKNLKTNDYFIKIFSTKMSSTTNGVNLIEKGKKASAYQAVDDYVNNVIFE